MRSDLDSSAGRGHDSTQDHEWSTACLARDFPGMLSTQEEKMVCRKKDEVCVGHQPSIPHGRKQMQESKNATTQRKKKQQEKTFSLAV